MNAADDHPINEGQMMFDLGNECFGIVSNITVSPVLNSASNQMEMMPRVYLKQINLGEEKVYDTHPKALIHVTPEFIAQKNMEMHAGLSILNKVVAIGNINMGEKILKVEFRPQVKKKLSN